MMPGTVNDCCTSFFEDLAHYVKHTVIFFFFSARQHYSKGTLFVKKKIHQSVNAFRASINIGAKQLKVKDHILAKLLQIVLKLCLERHDSFMDMY